MLLTGLAALGTGLAGFASSAGGSALLGGAASAAGSLASNLLSSNSARHSAAKSFHYSKALFDYQNRYNYGRRYLDEIKGMKSAGINPILAYSSLGSAGAQASQFSSPMPDASLDLSSLGRSVSALAEKNSALKTAEEERKTMDFERRLKDMQLQLERSKVNSDIEVGKSLVALNDARRMSELEMPSSIKSQITLNNARSMLADSQSALVHSQINRADLERDYLAARIGLANDQAAFIRSNSANNFDFGLSLGPLGRWGLKWSEKEHGAPKPSSDEVLKRGNYKEGQYPPLRGR